MKRCRNCREPFEPRRSTTEVTCSTECAISYARASAPDRKERVQRRIVAAERRERRQEKTTVLDRLKRISKVIAETQREVNRYIRERDFGRPCISCGRKTGAQMHAGHYRTTKAAPQLRFNHDNLNLQCEHCNTFLSGNIVEYRKALVALHGVERVEALENDNRTVKWTREELLAIRREHTRLWRELRAARESKAA